MSFVREDLAAALMRWREVILAGGLALFGLWLVWLGGLLLVPLGLAVIALAAGWAASALRRLRFATDGEAPGLVEVVEGQVSYFGPTTGGAVGLPDLVELRLLTLRGRRVWKLRQGDGQTLLVPVEAQGADALFDAFAALPGLDTGDLVAALQEQPPTGGTNVVALDSGNRLVWARSGRGVLRS